MNEHLIDEYRLATQKGYALGAFNVFNMLTAQAVVQASNEMGMPVIIQMSTSTVKTLGIKKALMMFQTVCIDAEQTVMLHLDHCTDVAFAKQCIDAGWKSIMFDGSSLPFDENVRLTKEVVDYAKGKDVLVEGEIGVIQGVDDGVSEDYTRVADYHEVLRFVAQTHVDTIAPSIGTAHGLYEGTPTLNYELVEQLIQNNIGPLVIHGGTGLGEDVFRKLVSMGVAKINVSTALKHAYLDTMKAIVQGDLVYNPMDYDKKIVAGVKKVVLEHMAYFSGR
jgi:ketose-bisphosphate aldolase